MRMRLVLLAASALGLALSAPGLADAPAVIDPAEAVKHVGEQVTVEGIVVQVSNIPNEPIYLNFGGRYPKHVFAAVVFTANRERFPDAARWKGKKVRVTGTVQLYRGKPEIALSDPAQLTAVE